MTRREFLLSLVPGVKRRDAPRRTLHITPVDDLIAHELDAQCVCVPRVEEFRGDHGLSLLVTHHSLDGRELTGDRVEGAGWEVWE